MRCHRFRALRIAALANTHVYTVSSPSWRYPVGVSSMYTRTKHNASRVLVFARHAFLELIVISWKGFVEGYRVESLGYDDIARKTVWGC